MWVPPNTRALCGRQPCLCHPAHLATPLPPPTQLATPPPHRMVARVALHDVGHPLVHACACLASETPCHPHPHPATTPHPYLRLHPTPPARSCPHLAVALHSPSKLHPMSPMPSQPHVATRGGTQHVPSHACPPVHPYCPCCAIFHLPTS